MFPSEICFSQLEMVIVKVLADKKISIKHASALLQ
jgi:hypothetical protein